MRLVNICAYGFLGLALVMGTSAISAQHVKGEAHARLKHDGRTDPRGKGMDFDNTWGRVANGTESGDPVDCLSDSDCDDGNVCTVDICTPAGCEANHVRHAVALSLTITLPSPAAEAWPCVTLTPPRPARGQPMVANRRNYRTSVSRHMEPSETH